MSLPGARLPSVPPVEDAPPHEAFLDAVQSNPVNRAILDRLPALGLADCWLVAGCLFQAVWNRRDGRPAGDSVRDYDVFYFDDGDLSWEAEDRAIRRAAALFADLGVTVELRNQARVHLWYRSHFGLPCRRLTSSRDSIGRFPVAGTCIGVRPAFDGIALHAPYGLDDALSGILRPNPAVPATHLFRHKAASYRRRWPWLTVLDATAPARMQPPLQ